MSKEGWEQAREALGADFDKATSGRMTGLFDLSAEQVEKLKEADIFGQSWMMMYVNICKGLLMAKSV